VKPWWQVLAVPRDSDRATIRRAYAARLKVTNPEDDPQGFMALRQAYEAALSWVDGYGGYEFADVVATTVETEVVDDEPAPSPPPPPPDPVIEAAAAALAADRAALDKRFAALESGLRGPWFKDRAALETAFAELLAEPALMEIAARDALEYRIADLLAETIPRSDAILMDAIAAFGWDGEGNHPPAVQAILHRLDEWQLIGSMERGGHPLSNGWRALTREKRWKRHLDALRPGVPEQVEQLLDISNWQVPGIIHSYDSNAADWWRARLARPAFGFIDFAALAAGLLAAALFLWLAEAPAWQWGGAVIALLLGIGVPLARVSWIAPWRRAREEMGVEPGWPELGWVIPWAAATGLAMALPSGPLVAAAVAGLAGAGALWMLLTAARDPVFGNPLGRIVSFGLLILFAREGFVALPTSGQVALLGLALAAVLIGLFALGTLANGLWRLNRWPVATATALSLALLGGALVRAMLPDPPVALLYWGPAAMAGMVLIAAVRDVHDGSFVVRFAPLVRWGLWVVLVFAAIASVPLTRLPPPVAVTDPMQELERAEPSIAALRTGNPALYGIIETIGQRVADGKQNRDEGARQIDRLINTAYRERLPQAPTALIATELDIRLATMREFRTLDLRACADAGARSTTPTLSEALQRRHYRHALHVAGSSPATAEELARGREIPAADLFQRAANGDAAKAASLSQAMRGDDLAAKCDARIAVLEALSAQSDEVIAKTMRPTLIAQAASSSNAEKDDQAP